ncbi:hypothetical protein J2794_006308 [Paraburkholderia terricola]|jgi:hypothetical protein|uniref:hypothetical protein n=1 Tax=Paraburkholderia terricola TaxID=169427 RepID=UPI0028674D5D|nr:hypothetical protein [Paraburkholderia terricola]MDR6450168.1 hypothetical protein [Paraburkholderia terricola]
MPRQAIRAASCRNAGWQALFLHRLATSLSCFARVIEEAEIDAVQRLEVRLGIVCALHELTVTVLYDIAVQRELRSAAMLADHFYWQSGLGDERLLRGSDATELG